MSADAVVWVLLRSYYDQESIVGVYDSQTQAEAERDRLASLEENRLPPESTAYRYGYTVEKHDVLGDAGP